MTVDVGPDGATPRVSVVVPVFNAIRFLPRTAPPLRAAVTAHGAAELLFVDNGSTDASAPWLRDHGARVLSAPNATVSGVRNAGARAASGRILAFVDSDCIVSDNYLTEIERTLQDAGVHACGSRYRLPESPHWIERVWHDLHEQPGQTNAVYVPAGNFAIRKSVFDAIGGFREDLLTGEDADIGLRLTEAGYVIRYAPAVSVVHLGNPASLRDFYRKQRWHGLGMFGTVRTSRLDRPVFMTLMHAAIIVVALVMLRAGPISGVLLLLAGVWLVPAASVAFRVRRGARVGGSVLRAILLYQLYYFARLAALASLVTRRGR